MTAVTDGAFRALDLEPDSPPDAVVAAFRRKVFTLRRPDGTPDEDAVSRLAAQRDVAFHAARALRCLTCDGLGSRTVGSGFSFSLKGCESCAGTGLRYPRG